ncbi:MAG: response regulator [Cyclobacteriaceae bacterium]|nr:response regulator [Cyclobacteriaceae bacterium]
MNKIFLAALLTFFVNVAFAQISKIDSVESMLSKHTPNDTLKVKLWNELSYHHIGINYYKAREYAMIGLKLADSLSYKLGISIAKNRLALCYWVLGDGELAIKHAMDVIHIVENENLDVGLLADTYRILGVTYSDQLEFSKAEYYLNKSMEVCVAKKNWGMMLRIYVGAGVIQLAKNKPDSALYLFTRSLSIEKEHPNDYYLPVIYTNIGSVYSNKYFNNLGIEVSYYEKALALSEKIENRYATSRVLSRLGFTYLQSRKFDKSETYLTESQKIARSIGLKTVVRDNYLLLMELKLAQGNLPQSLYYQKAYYDLKDSLSNEKITREIVELETRYDTDKKQKEIQLLLQQKRADRILQISLAIGIILLASFSVIVYLLQNQRNLKAKQLLAFQKTVTDKLKEADVLKSRFFANISHEFRAPLSLIIAPIEEKLAFGSKSGMDYETSKLVLRNAQRLLNLVNQILDLSKLEAKKMELQLKVDDLSSFLQLITDSFAPLALQKKISFLRDIHLSSREFLFDSDKMEKIITNLLMNSFKFTPPDGTITIQVTDQDPETGIKIVIKDTGIGIPEEDQHHLFSAFYQVREGIDGDHGTGLGLSLVKELVKLHQGNIYLESTFHKGTIITVTIPLQKPKTISLASIQSIAPVSNQNEVITPAEASEHLETMPPSHEESPEAKQTILIVEDNPDLQNYLASILSKQYVVAIAKDGVEGLESAYEQIPDLILSDVMMPRMNGIDLLEKIKQNERTSHIPVILLTAKADLESRLTGLKIGADDYLAKPFVVEELFIRIANLLNLRKKLAQKYMTRLSNQNASKVVNEPSLDEKFLQKAKLVVERNISDSLFSVESLADEMHLSRAQLFRKLKAISGLSPNEFISDIRLLRAAEMIKGKVDTLTQISYSVGFNEQSYFAKRFKKKFGMTPSEYGENTK